ncbi:MAG: histidine kinase dimerization/phosphoacceptor domain -containing protein, partial [Ekhidna sp.]
MLKKVLFLLLSIAFTQPSIAQNKLLINPEGVPPITSYSSEDYQGYSQVWDIIQDQKGLIYITTTTAIHEFDGTNWRRIETPTRSSIGRNFVINDKNRIYLGGINLMGYLAPDSLGLMHFVSLLDSMPENSSVDNVEFVKYLDGKVYFSGKKGIFIYDELSKEISHFDTETKAYPNFILNNKIHFNIAEKGIFAIENDTLSLISDTHKNSSISDILVDKNNEVTLVSSTEGLIHFDVENSYSIDAFTDPFFKENFAYKALNLSDDYNLICFLKAGVVITDRDWNPILHLDKDHIKDNQVHNAHLDEDQNLWLATNSGISVIELASSLSIFNKNNGVEGAVLDITENGGQLFVSTSAGIYSKPWQLDLNAVNKEDMQFTQVPNAGIYSYDLLSTSSGVLVKSYESIGLIKDGVFSKLVEKSSQKASLAFLKDSIHTFTTGRNGSEIEILKLSSNRWNHIRTIQNDLLPKMIFFLVYDATNERIWGANPSQLFSFNISDNLKEILNYKEYSAENGLPSNERNWFQVIDNEVVFATTNGLYTFDQSTERFSKKNRFGDYFDTIGIQTIQNEKSAEPSYWYTTNSPVRGMYRLKDDYTSTKMTVLSKQIQSLHVSDYLGTFLGGATLDFYMREKEEKYDFEFMPVIRKVDNITKMDSTIYYGSNHSETLTVPHNEKSMRFTYSIPYYRHPEWIRYQYKLDGFDEDWSAWSPKNEKEYTNLPSGEFQFKVRAKNAFGTVSPEGFISVKITKPWYLDWWMILIYFILFSIVIWFIIFLNSRRLKAENERLEGVVEQRTREIRNQKETIQKSLLERESLLKEIHHRVKNNLQIIASLLYLQSGKFEDEDFKKVLEEGQGRVRSMALIHQKLYENDNLKSIPFGEYLKELVSEIRASFGMANVQLNIEAEGIFFDVDTAVPLGLIVNEMATNAFKYAYHEKQKGTLSIFLTEENGQYLLNVKDDGKGIPDEIDIRKTKSL